MQWGGWQGARRQGKENHVHEGRAGAIANSKYAVSGGAHFYIFEIDALSGREEQGRSGAARQKCQSAYEANAPAAATHPPNMYGLSYLCAKRPCDMSRDTLLQDALKE